MKRLWITLFLFPLFGCQIGYMMKSGYNQMSLLSQRVSVDEALKDPRLDEESKRKLRLSQEAHQFAEQELKLANTKNYTSFVQLDRPYVTYVVNAAPKWKLEHYHWWFPFVGNVPYKGYFNENDAKELQEDLKKQDLDTYMRGVSAYSTLGWFNDPLLSSMLRYKDYDLVNTIIHETVHATLYIKSSADFNERMAVFLGNKGSEIFYHKKEGADSPTLQRIQRENEDDRIFSKFITEELKLLKAWYQDQPVNQHDEEIRKKRIAEIKEHFKSQIQPQLKTDQYSRFPEIELNNARLMLYKTYMQDLSDFEALFKLTNENFTSFLLCCERLKNHDKPEEGLKKIVGWLQEKQLHACDTLTTNQI